MTIDEARKRVINRLNAEVGYREGANNWNKYAEALDKIDGLTWGPKQNQPWCGEFDLAIFVECFGVEKALKMLYSPKPTSIPLCSAGAQYFKDAGAWHSTPQLGDIVFFNVSGGINHQGVVTAVGMGAITTVEGNSSDMVARRTYVIGSANIAGYGRPDWAAVSAVENAPDGETEEDAVEAPQGDKLCEIELPMLCRGASGEAVRAAQILLIGRGYRCGPWGADGDFGDATYGAVYQFQRARGLEIDGVVGGETWKKLLTN